MATNKSTLTTESLLELVVHPRRREILRHLQENADRAVTIDELTQTVAFDGGTITSRDDSRATAASVALHHTHLPKLADAGIIDYDSRRETVRYRGDDRLEALLAFIATRLE